MDKTAKAKGSFGQRFFIIILSIVLGVLFFWLLGFITDDIGNMQGPSQPEIRDKYVSKDLQDKQNKLNKDVKEFSRQIETIRQQQKILQDSSNSLQNTINQLMSSIKDFESNVELSQTIRQSQAAFLENQKKYEANNNNIAELTRMLNGKQDELAAVNEQVNDQEIQARTEYNRLYEKHRLKVAAVKLAFLLPVFLAIAFFFMKQRTANYWPLAWASFIAIFIKVALVIHEYFPSRYFKYIALLVMIAIVLRILVYLIFRLVKPKKDLLIKQYQQDYDKNLCPICSKPIRTNQLVFSSLSKMSQKSDVLKQMQSDIQPTYTCPSCGTNLYEKCDNCSQTRHSLLPYCLNCGAEKLDLPH